MTAPTDAPAVVPGVYEIDADTYHADPIPGGSLSSSGARRILPPGCPALYRWEQDHAQPPKRHFDIGTAAHALALGDGPELALIDAPDYKTANAQQQRDAARASGAVPLLPHEMQQVQDMAEALHQHPRVRALLTDGTGEVEQTLIWQDEETGIWCRARLDWLADKRIVDIKTTTDASPEAIQKAVWRFGYHQQADWYESGARAVLGGDHEFTFIFQAKEPPYLVTVVDLDVMALRIGEARNRRARHIYRDCRQTGHWPDFGDHTHTLPLPPWAEHRDTEEYLS